MKEQHPPNNGQQIDPELMPTEHMDFRSAASWRIFRIMAEFIEGFQFLADLKREVTFFGSARTKPGEHFYDEARKLGKMLGKAGFTVVTGGGPGIMEAGNRGAHEAKATSVGLNIQLPREQRTNPFITKGMGFHYFFVRKVMLSASSQAYIFFPGGFGTIDELMELIVLIQTNKMKRIPIVLVGRKFWGGLFGWIRETVLEKYSFIEAADMDIATVVDTAEEVFAIVKKSKEREYF